MVVDLIVVGVVGVVVVIVVVCVGGGFDVAVVVRLVVEVIMVLVEVV